MTVLEVTRGLLDPKPLLDAAGYVPGEQGARATAERLGVSQRQVVRWAQGERIRSVTADQCAIRLDRHPAEIWGANWTGGDTEGGELIELPQRDQKAGWSTECRADRHGTCAMAGMRCTCTCHGRAGQTPPAPAPKAPPVQRPLLVVAPEPEENPVSNEYPCPIDGCDRTFGSLHASQVHVARSHKAERTARSTKARPEPPAGKPEAAAPKVEAKQLLVVDREHFLEVDTVPDLERVADLLAALGHDVLLAVPR